jgi:hypothetical protein
MWQQKERLLKSTEPETSRRVWMCLKTSKHIHSLANTLRGLIYGTLIKKPAVRNYVTFKKQLHVTTNRESDF